MRAGGQFGRFRGDGLGPVLGRRLVLRRNLIVLRTVRLYGFLDIALWDKPPLISATRAFHMPAAFRYVFIHFIPGRTGRAFNDGGHGYFL